MDDGFCPICAHEKCPRCDVCPMCGHGLEGADVAALAQHIQDLELELATARTMLDLAAKHEVNG